MTGSIICFIVSLRYLEDWTVLYTFLAPALHDKLRLIVNHTGAYTFKMNSASVVKFCVGSGVPAYNQSRLFAVVSHLACDVLPESR